MLKYNYADVIDTINEQLQDTSAELCHSLSGIITGTVYKKIFVAAAGRSKMVANMFAMRLMHLGYDVRVVGETTPRQSEQIIFYLQFLVQGRLGN